MISIHAPREGSDGWISGELTITVISIHAPREGSDRLAQLKTRIQLTHISIHAPREGSDYHPHQRLCHGKYFNPRSP